jgi:hypothetical protein
LDPAPAQRKQLSLIGRKFDKYPLPNKKFMKKSSGLFILFQCILLTAASQTLQKQTKKGVLYGAFGSQRIFYSPSTIRLISGSTPSFDFTLYKAKAKDEGGIKFHTAPQFSYTIGYYFKNKGFGLEYHYDHIKYFLTQNQRVHLKGTINGVSYDKDTTLISGFVQLEHSDGANYAMVNIVKWIPLIYDKRKDPIIELLLKAGIGVVNPKTNSTIMGDYRDDQYHISGYVVGAEPGFRLHFAKYGIATASLKGTFANYNHFLIAHGFGSQKWFGLQFNYMAGVQIPL